MTRIIFTILLLINSIIIFGQIKTDRLKSDTIYIPLLKNYLDNKCEDIDLSTLIYYSDNYDSTKYFIYNKYKRVEKGYIKTETFVTYFNKSEKIVRTKKVNDNSIFEFMKRYEFSKKVLEKTRKLSCKKCHYWLNPRKMQIDYNIIYNGFVYNLERYNEFYTSPIITNEEYLKLIIEDIIKQTKPNLIDEN